jgi:rubrerythrin
MPTLTPTKATGSTAKASEVTYVEPDQAVTDDLLRAEVSADGVDAAVLADVLSACLAHERCGVHLYRSVAGRTTRPELRSQYEAFGAQTERHVEILEGVVLGAGGNPSYVSPMARATEAMNTNVLQSTFLAPGGLEPAELELVMLDAVHLAETTDHANWEMLALVASQLPDGDLRTALAAAVAEVQPQEDEHYGWARLTRATLTSERLGLPPPPPLAMSVRGGSVDLESATKEELYAMAQELDIPGRSEMTKDELLSAIRTR